MGDKIPLVVLHGWGHDKSSWEAFAKRFHDRPVISIDLPGFGTEPLVSGNWGVPEYADWTEQKIDSLHQGEVVLLGHSFGGRIAALIASRRPAWLSGLILYGAPVLYRPTFSIRARIVLAKFLKPALKGFRAKGNAELEEADTKGLGPVFRRVIPFDQTELLPKITVPTLLLWGEQDTSVSSRIAEEAHTLIPGSELTFLPGAGHNAHLELPDLFYGTVTRFLAHL